MTTGSDIFSRVETEEVFVTFEHRFFTCVDHCHFRISDHTGQAAFVMRFGDNDIALSISAIKAEFDIGNDEADGSMLDLVTRALGFVRVLRPGDPLPREILTREASWDAADRHREIARRKLTGQLLAWFEKDGGGSVRLETLEKNPGVQSRVHEAFRAASRSLGLGSGDEVVQRLGELAGELAYIEALREVARDVLAMRRKVRSARRLHSRERSIGEPLDAIGRLLGIALPDLRDRFAAADRHVEDVMAALGHLGTRLDDIRECRDDLYCRVLAWDDVLPRWNALAVVPGGLDAPLLHDTYRFLACRYMPADEWVLAMGGMAGAGDSSMGLPHAAEDTNGDDRFRTAMKW